VVPTFNRLSLLREAVASVQSQTYPDWELIIVDDGSSDGTGPWVRSLGDSRISLIVLPHTGNLGHVRNQGNAAARGKFIAFLDSDDLFENNKLEVQLKALAAHPECGWSYTNVTAVDAAGVPLDRRSRFRAISGWILHESLRFDALLATPTIMVQRELLERVGPLDEALAECQDYELYFRFAAVSPAVALSEPLSRVRVHAGTLSADRTLVNETWIYVYERFGARSADPAVRKTCARQVWKHHLGAASSWARGRGRPGPAFAHVVVALVRRPWSPRVWRVLLADVVMRGIFKLRR
jgi:glycosyltransferase involved in cell wall biosynthesis